jgi:hypothetical protein
MIRLSRSKMTVIACGDSGRDKPCPYEKYQRTHFPLYLLSEKKELALSQMNY